MISVQGTEDVRLLNAALINGFTMITFQRPLLAADKLTDKQIFTNASQPIIWAVGPVNSQGHPSYHSARGQGAFYELFFSTPRVSLRITRPGDRVRSMKSFFQWHFLFFKECIRSGFVDKVNSQDQPS